MMYKLIIEEPGREPREAFVDVKNSKKLKKICDLLLPNGSKVEYVPAGSAKAGE